MSREIAAFLSKVRLFSALPPAVITRVAAQANKIEFASDQIVFFTGDPADRVYIIMRGEVAVETVSTEGRTVTIASLSIGEVFGEMAVLDQGRRSANIRTRLPSTILSISKAVFLDLIATQPGFAMLIIEDLVSRLRITDAQIESITLQPLRARLAGLLIDLGDAQGETIRVTQINLAERLSATREKVNGHLQILQDAGAVKLGRGKVRIIDWAALKTFLPYTI